MLTLENMGAVREAYRQDLRDLQQGVYVAPLPSPAMYCVAPSYDLVRKNTGSPFSGIWCNRTGMRKHITATGEAK